MKYLVLGAVALAACATETDEGRIGRTSTPIFGGRPSGDDENAAVYVLRTTETGFTGCTGLVVAPGLVVTARHCVMRSVANNFECGSDGEIVDTGADVRLSPVDQIEVFVGAHRASWRRVAVREVVGQVQVTICVTDVVFLVLAEPGVDSRVPLRRKPVTLGEEASVTGWGITSDGSPFPPERWTLDGIPVTEVGPGFIPKGTFSLRGNSVCFGDSGASARVDGAVVGVYSRIQGQSCAFEGGRHIFTAVTGWADLPQRAYAAIGEEPWYAGEQRPWLAAAGAACTRDDECRSARCDAATSTCAAPCGNATKPACAADQQCNDATQTCEPLPPEKESCSTSATGRSGGGLSAALALALAACVTTLRRFRRRRRPT
jgi:hypothetical protein